MIYSVRKLFSRNFLIGFLMGFIALLILGYASGQFKPSTQVNSNLDSNPDTANISKSLDLNDENQEKLISDFSAKIVGIQVFKNNKLVRSGSGVILSSDGLVVTTADIGISGAVYQIAYDQKLAKASAEFIDYGKNLFLLKADTQFPVIAELNLQYEYLSGKNIVLVGKVFDISDLGIFSKKGIISFVTDRLVEIDTSIYNYVSGLAVGDLDGNFLGLSYLSSGKIFLIRAEVIRKSFDDYLSANFR